MFVAIAMKKKEDDRREALAPFGHFYLWSGPSGMIQPEFGETEEAAAQKLFRHIKRDGCGYNYDVLVAKVTHTAEPTEPPIKLTPFLEKQ